jgi:tRNA nucleotidyltransferase (CCA-adding enzyme)
MIKYPKEVKSIIKSIEEKGFEVYAVGGCVRDSLLGKEPPDWDLATNAAPDELAVIFPEAGIAGEKFGVISLTAGKSDAVIPVDVATFRADGVYSDYRRPDSVIFIDKLEDDLARRDFTVNAMADNPEKGLTDLYGGIQDINDKIIKTVGDPLVRFEEDPLRMIRAARFAAQLGFEIDNKTYGAISKKYRLLKEISADRIRQEFEKIMVAEFAGSGLKILARTGMMNYIIGDLAERMKKRALSDFADLTENIDKTSRIRERRLGLFYTCFEEKDAFEAVNVLNYDAKTIGRIKDAFELLDPMHFIATKLEFKKFISKYGMERYEYVDGLAKAKYIVHDLPNSKAKTRHYIMQEIKANGEPVFIKDLAINGNDIIERGIAEGERVGKILALLLDIVHSNPKYNQKDYLLARAREYSENKLTAAIQRMRWVR